jgi:hypothetical protein
LHIPDLEALPDGGELARDGVLRDVILARWATRNDAPRLAAALAHARRANALDDIEALDYAFREIAVAAMSSLSRLRAAYPELPR